MIKYQKWIMLVLNMLLEFREPFIGVVVVGMAGVEVAVELGNVVTVIGAVVTGGCVLVNNDFLLVVVSSAFVVIAEGIIVEDSTVTVEVEVVSGPDGGLIDGNVGRKVVAAFGG